MKRFDCLAADCPLFGPHLLEASAGTGKTFSIEHIFLRILLESKETPVQLEEILVVTFTRAATRELKGRIRANLEKAIAFLREEREGAWPYLQPFVGAPDAIQTLSDALAIFDRCQIFTIHGFCYRMLREFAFEAGLGFSLSESDPDPGEMRRSMSDFFEKGIGPDLCPEQIALLLKKYDSMEEISRRLIRSQKQQGPSFKDQSLRYAAALKTWTGEAISTSLLRDDFAKVRDQYKSQVKGDFDRQIDCFSRSFSDPLSFRKLIWDRGTLFSFLHPANKKVKAKETAPLHYPGFFDWAVLELGPIILDAADPKKIFATLAYAWKQQISSENDFYQPDEILLQMQKAMEVDPFGEKIGRRFKAVIIDEFQDTDPLQWEIFRKLSQQSLRAFYLVGDPKQSIYRFRSADVYTYFSARDYLGETHLYHLDTNFRSSKELIGSLNALFDRQWLPLPKTFGIIPYIPVKAGSATLSDLADLADAKQALHWIVGNSDATYLDTFLPYAIEEIERLSPASLRSIAILVKDRYEVQSALDLLRMRGIPAVARSHQPIGKTEAFRSVRELLEEIASPNDESREKIAQLGAFAGRPLSSWKGLVPFFAQFFSGRPLSADIKQILEELFAWQQREGFSFEGLQRFLDEFEKRDADEGGRRRMDEAGDAIQVMTLHIAKGLEFDVVFALGLASRPSGDEDDAEELDAEKLRQLYVAMTRAKKRLYVPVIKSTSSKGPFSPMELFSQKIELQEGPLLPFLERLSQKESVSVEEVSSLFSLPPKSIAPSLPSAPPAPLPRIPFSPSYLFSFTSLAKPKEHQGEKAPTQPPVAFTLETLPRGTETGIVVHQIFENLFNAPAPIWRDNAAVDLLVERELRFSPLLPWVGPIREMVRNTLSMSLSDGERTFSLKQLEPDQLFVEMEFLYFKEPHYVKGFIDLVFSHQGKFYILDWKTNWVKDSLDQVMETHDYGLQAALYAEALRRHLSPGESFADKFGGALYLFVRAGLYVHFKPDMSRLESCYGN
jgi:exodeoxyribonuclease V beta subunit